MSIIKDILQAIGSLFRKVPNEVRDIAEIAISITKRLQVIVNSKEATALVDIIPGNLDNSILVLLRTVLPKIEAEIKPQSEELIQWLTTLPDEVQKAIYGHIMGMITEKVVKDITLSQAKMYSQIVFTKMKSE